MKGKGARKLKKRAAIMMFSNVQEAISPIIIIIIKNSK